MQYEIIKCILNKDYKYKIDYFKNRSIIYTIRTHNKFFYEIREASVSDKQKLIQKLIECDKKLLKLIEEEFIHIEKNLDNFLLKYKVDGNFSFSTDFLIYCRNSNCFFELFSDIRSQDPKIKALDLEQLNKLKAFRKVIVKKKDEIFNIYYLSCRKIEF